MTPELLFLSAIERGLSLSDFDEMTVGMVLDYIALYNERNNSNKEDQIQEATQADIDAFFG